MNSPVAPGSNQNLPAQQQNFDDNQLPAGTTYWNGAQPSGPGAGPGGPYTTGGYHQGPEGAGSYATGTGSYATGAAAPRTSTEDPGKVLGIISLVATLSTFIGFNFIGPVVGIITGYFARKYSRGAGYADNELGKWGFILGIVFLGLALLGGLIGVSIGAVSGLWGLYSGW